MRKAFVIAAAIALLCLCVAAEAVQGLLQRFSLLERWGNMKYILAALILAMVLSGCGGGGGSSPSVSPLAGSWQGSWTRNAESGTLTLTIADSGTIRGTVSTSTWSEAIINGSGMLADGRMVLHYGDSIQALGPVVLNNGHLTGTLAITEAGIYGETLHVDLVRQ